MRVASFLTSSIDLTTLTPPALPRPPAWICAFTTQTGPPSSCAPLTASSTDVAGTPRGTGTPNFFSTPFAWYSWIFISSSRFMPASSDRLLRKETAALPRPQCSSQIRSDLLAGLDQPLHRLRRFLERVTFRAVERNFDDALDALAADHHRHADVKILDAVFAVEPGRGRHHALLVEKVALRHRDGRRSRRIERRARLEQIDDLRAAVRGALDDLVDTRLRGPAHLDEIRNRNAGDRRITRQRHHGVAVTAEHEGRDVLDRDVEFVGEKITEARGVE